VSINLVRMRFAAVAAKVETTAGTDAIAGSPVAADWVAGDCQVTFNPNVAENPELTGSLDKSPGIVGGLRPGIRMRIPLRGSGTAGTAPEFGKLLRCCTYAETVTAAAIGAPTALPAGSFSTTSFTLATTPFAATAQLYRGMPLLLSGVVAATTGITDYTAARVATIGSTLSAIPTTTTLAQIPINVLYGPTSDETVFRTCTLYFYADGLLWAFTGCSGTWGLDLTSGEIGYVTVEMQGQFSAVSAAALPAGWATVSRPTPPRWVAGASQLNRLSSQIKALSLQAGVRVVLPDDPEAAEGYGPGVPIERDSTGTIDPYMNTANQVALMTNFRTGVNMPLMIIVGSTAGNRFLITAPSARAVAFNPGARDGLGTNQISLQLDGADSDLFLAQF
jgi:hypothetical protein